MPLAPTITWVNPAALIYGMPLSGTQLNATASVPGVLVYTPAAGTVLLSGHNQVLSVHFTPTDHDYAEATTTVYIDVTSPDTVITWSSPAAITYGTPLSTAQLNATASAGGTLIDGTFDYTLTAGTVLGAGAHQALDVLFTPSDHNYGGGHATVYIDVDPAPLTVSGITAANKPYDGGTTATLNTSTAALVGVVSGDDVTLSGTAVGAFSNANVGTSKIVTVSGLTLGGTAASNYSLTQPTTTANITKADATIAVDGYTGTYDGLAHGATGTATGVLSEPLAGLDLGASFTDIPGGTANWTFTDVTGNNNDDSGSVPIVLTQAGSTTVVTFESVPYVYRGTAFTATAAVTGAGGLSTSVPVVISGDCTNVTTTDGCTATATYPGDLNHITSTDAKSITITALGLTVSGITAANKPYDGGTTATLNTGTAALVGVVSGDTVNLNTGSAAGAFGTPTVGTGKTVIVSGLTLGGTAASNYSLTQSTTTANITTRPITVTGITAANKPYDGGTTATLNTSTAALVGVVSGDDVTRSEEHTSELQSR